jgi:hypothetical protein
MPVPYIIILPFYIKVMALFFIFLGGWIGYEFSKFYLSYKSIFLSMYGFSWFFASM